jgi:quinol monooxygenase YgiN
MKIDELDPATPFLSQLQGTAGPVTLINTFIVPPERAADFLDAWRADAAYMKSSPGCISAQMHRGTEGSQVMVNVAVWESTEALFAAFRTPEFQAAAARYPAEIVAYPHVLQKVAVAGICTA